jgi:hypothetical protein
MDDNGNIIYYIILGAIYLLSRVFGKKKKKPGAVPTQKRKIAPPTAESEEAPSVSFEDILRELSGAKQPKPEPDPDPIPAPAFSPPTKSVREAAFEKAFSRDEIDEIAVDYEVPKAIGSETNYTPPIKRNKLAFKRTEHFRIKKKIAVDYLEILSEEDGPARAFVMSEIFARKY